MPCNDSDTLYAWDICGERRGFLSSNDDLKILESGQRSSMFTIRKVANCTHTDHSVYSPPPQKTEGE